MRHGLAFTAAIACAIAGTPARAEVATFQFSQFFASGSLGSLMITGSFSGNVQGNRISDFTDIKLFRNGIAFRGSGSLFTAQYDVKTRHWSEGGYLSLDGSANNVMFIDTDYAHGNAGFFNYFFSTTGIGNAAFQPSYQHYRVAQTNQLTVLREPPHVPPPVPGVPEPSTWALLVLGFGVIGAGQRRRNASRQGFAA